MTVQLVSPKVSVLMADGTEYTDIQTINADLVRYDRVRQTRGWPLPEDAKMLWLSFISWAACKRLQLIGDMDYDTWEGGKCLGVVPGNGTAVDPTQSGAELE